MSGEQPVTHLTPNLIPISYIFAGTKDIQEDLIAHNLKMTLISGIT